MRWSSLFVLLFSFSLYSCGQPKEEEKMGKVIYVMDPHCGWCYGNSPNILAVYEQFKSQLDFELLVGGMWVGENAPQGGEGFAQFIQDHSPRMEKTTGAYVSESFYKLSGDSSYVFNSLKPAAAIYLVKQLAEDKSFQFASAIQTATFAEGKRLDKLATYLPILKQLDIDQTVFEERWLSQNNLQATEQEFIVAGQYASGFPTLLFQDSTGIQPLASGYFEKEKMVNQIRDILNKKQD
jgi:putative protein-disulfide isomerase